jgi:hypothetical protein
MDKAFPQVNWEDDFLPELVVNVVFNKQLFFYCLQRLVLHILEQLELLDVFVQDKAILYIEQAQILLEQSEKHLQVLVGDPIVLNIKRFELNWVLFRADERGAEQL